MARSSAAICLLLLVTLSAVCEVHGHFLMRHYLRKLPRRSRAFRPFACQGMLRFVDLLQHRCPLTRVYKNFFGSLRSYVSFINSASGSSNFNVELKGRAEGLHNAMTALTGNSGSSADSSRVMDVLLSMGNTLNEQERTSTFVTFRQRRELIISMVKWAQVIVQFVSTTASKNGNPIDVSSLGLDGIDVNVDASNDGGDSPTTGGSPSNPTGGSPTTGGSPSTPTGGYPTNGGSPSTPTGGYPTGGSPTNGGSPNTPTGGSPTTGGSPSTPTGGSPATGGSPSTETGGSTNKGYGTATGGSTNTATGYGTATGGSTNTNTVTSANGAGLNNQCIKCANGGGSNGGTALVGGASSYQHSGQGSINFQHSGQGSSQHTATGKISNDG